MPIVIMKINSKKCYSLKNMARQEGTWENGVVIKKSYEFFAFLKIFSKALQYC